MRDAQYWVSVVHELCAMPHEAGWVEFKHNNAEPQEIGEYISALANACALEGKAHPYLLWGVEDATHALLGTSFDPVSKLWAMKSCKAGYCASSRPSWVSSSSPWR